MTYETHPYAEVWPSLEGADFDNLVTDIRVHGLRNPIILYAGKVLDGRNRMRACDEAGVEPRFETYNGTETQAMALVRSLNEHRRHSPEELRQQSIAKLIERIREIDQNSR